MTFPAQLIERLARAKSVVVLTGAGVSAESGVPTFRDAQTGLWARFKPEELATPRAFLNNPRLVWEWYDWRRKLVADARPNPATSPSSNWKNAFPLLPSSPRTPMPSPTPPPPTLSPNSPA